MRTSDRQAAWSWSPISRSEATRAYSTLLHTTLHYYSTLFPPALYSEGGHLEHKHLPPWLGPLKRMILCCKFVSWCTKIKQQSFVFWGIHIIFHILRTVCYVTVKHDLSNDDYTDDYANLTNTLSGGNTDKVTWLYLVLLYSTPVFLLVCRDPEVDRRGVLGGSWSCGVKKVNSPFYCQSHNLGKMQ